MMNELSYNRLASFVPEAWDKDKIHGYVIAARHCKSEKAVSYFKLLLFKEHSKIIVRNINNFFFLTSKYAAGREVLHTKDELVTECFISLENCIRNFDFGKNKYFYWYYNKALTWRMKRIFEDNYELQTGTVTYDPLIRSESSIKMEPDLIRFYLKKMKLKNIEKNIIYSKLRQEPAEIFLQNHPNVDINRYYKLFKGIKEKFKNFENE